MFQYLKHTGMKTKAKFKGEEWREDYHNLPYGQLCLLDREEKKTGGGKKREKVQEIDGRNRNSNNDFGFTTACSFISNLENSSGHACLDELEKFHTLRPATLT